MTLTADQIRPGQCYQMTGPSRRKVVVRVESIAKNSVRIVEKSSATGAPILSQ